MADTSLWETLYNRETWNGPVALDEITYYVVNNLSDAIGNPLTVILENAATLSDEDQLVVDVLATPQINLEDNPDATLDKVLADAGITSDSPQVALAIINGPFTYYNEEVVWTLTTPLNAEAILLADSGVINDWEHSILPNGNVCAQVELTDVTKLMTLAAVDNNDVAFTTSDDVVVRITGGDNNAVTTGAGNDTVYLDTISSYYSITGAQINAGAGDDTIILGYEDVEAAIDGGEGFNIVQTSTYYYYDYYQYNNGKFEMTDNMRNISLSMENIFGLEIASQSVTLATSMEQSLLAKLSYIISGNRGYSLSDINDWMNKGVDSTSQLVVDFLDANENFTTDVENQSNSAFVSNLWENATNDYYYSEINGFTESEYISMLDSEVANRYQVAWQIAASDVASKHLGSQDLVIDSADFTATPLQEIFASGMSISVDALNTWLDIVNASDAGINSNALSAAKTTLTNSGKEEINVASISSDSATLQAGVNALGDLSLQLLTINGPDSAPENVADWTLTSSPDAEIILMGKNTAANVTFDETSATTLLGLGQLGSTVEFTTSSDVTVYMNGADKDTVTTAAGNDTVYYYGGNDINISTGDGNDVVNLRYIGSSITVDLGAGDDTACIYPDSEFMDVSASIDGGEGFNIVQYFYSSYYLNNLDFQYNDGKFELIRNDEYDEVNYTQTISLENIFGLETINSWGDTSYSITFATSMEQSLLAKLYYAVSGTSYYNGLSLSEINDWINKDVDSTSQLVVDFLDSNENFITDEESQSNSAFVYNLFSNATGSYAEISGFTAEDYVYMLDSGLANRYQVGWEIAASAEAAEHLGANGEKLVIDSEDFTADPLKDILIAETGRSIPVADLNLWWNYVGANEAGVNTSAFSIANNILTGTGRAEINVADINSDYATLQAGIDALEDISLQLLAINGPETAPEDAADWTLTSAPDAEIILMGENTAADVTFANTSATTMLSLGALGSTVEFTTSRDVTVIMNGADKDSVTTGAGDDVVYFYGGDDVNISTGNGDDTVAVETSGSGLAIDLGLGNDNVYIYADKDIAATIYGGIGVNSILVTGSVDIYAISVDGDKFVLENNDLAPDSAIHLDLTNVSFVNYRGVYNNQEAFTVLADTVEESLIGKLHYVAFSGAGPTTAMRTVLSQNYDSLADLVDDYLNGFHSDTVEFASVYDKMTDAECAQTMFDNLNKYAATPVTSINGKTVDQYAAEIESGSLTRQQVAWDIAASSEATAILGIDGAKLVIDSTQFDYAAPGSTTPDEPVNPDEPDNPDTPDNPDNPDEPENPDNPDTPDTPENPDNPDTPDTPENPDAPSGVLNLTMPETAVSDAQQWVTDSFANASAGSALNAAAVTQAITLTSLPDSVTTVEMNDISSLNTAFAADSTRTALTLTGSSNSEIAFESARNIDVTLNNANGASVTTGSGADTVTYNGGENGVISTGAGADTINLMGSGSATVTSGAGDDMFNLYSGANITATINGNGGFNVLTATGSRMDHTFAASNSTTFTMNSDSPLTMQNIDIAVFVDTPGEITTDSGLTIFAETQAESLVGKLYQIVLGRSALDGPDNVLGGIKFWTDDFSGTTQHLVYSFLNCQECHDKHDSQTDAQYVNSLFSNLNELATTNAVDTVAGHTAQDYVDMLENGVNRFDVAWQFAASSEAVQILGAGGANYVIDGGDFVDDNIV